MDLGQRATAHGARRLVGILGIVVGAAVATSWLGPGVAPAGAHTVGGVAATDYRTRITAREHPFPGVTVRPVDSGNQLELTNTSARDVIVRGYDGEAYLRVGPRGVYENRNSPATYLNRTRLSPAAPPDRADPAATPAWHRISGGTSVRWHDHRAHWMGTVAPPAVRHDPGRAQLVQRFALPVVRGGTVVRVRGDVWWVPGPSPWPWIAVAAGLASLVVVLARTRRAAWALGAALATGALAAVVHAGGSWTTGAAAFAGRLGAAVPTLGAVGLAAVALVVLRRKGLRAAAPVLVFAGLFLTIAIGLADLSALSHSQVPTVLAVPLDRAAITLALGLGAGVTIGAAVHVADRGPAAARPPLGSSAGQE